MTIDLARSEEFSSQFLNWVVGKGNILILAHDNPDPDSLASAMALKHLILIKAGLKATVAFGGVIGRGENRVMVQKLEIDAVPIDQLDLDRFQVICMVDTQPGTGNNSLPSDRIVDLVIDHHPARQVCTGCRWVDIRENYGASASILFEYLLAQKVTISTKLATILFYAIKSETQDLGREWCKADREAYLHLLPLANNRILFDIIHPEVPRQYFASYCRAISNAKTYDDVLVFNLHTIDNPDMVAEMTDFLLRVDGIVVALGMGLYQDMEILSMRTLRHDINAGEVMGTIVKKLGTGGGHGMIAGGQVRPVSGERADQVQLEKTLTDRLLEALGRKTRKGKKLVSP